MKRSQAFPSRYLSKDDVTPPITVSIRAVKVELMDEQTGETKPVAYFDGDIKPAVVNQTNWMTLEDLYGEDSDTWTGKTIEIWNDPNVMYGGKRTGGVRFRKAAETSNGHAPAAASQTPTERWQAFVFANTVTDAHIRTALGFDKVGEWIKAGAGRTLQQAMDAILEVQADF